MIPINLKSPTSRKEREKWGTLRFLRTEKRATPPCDCLLRFTLSHSRTGLSIVEGLAIRYEAGIAASAATQFMIASQASR